jgi:predicted DNA-binding transcriptional regulator AlpA
MQTLLKTATDELLQRRLLSDFDLEEITGRARSTWQKARLTGDGPPFIRIGRLVRYRASDVEAWLAARPSHRSTSGAGQHVHGENK